MNIVERLKTYMEHTGLPISQFADQALIPRPTLSQILSGRNKKISNEILEKLHTAFPSLNVAWLLFGDGEMERATANPPKKQGIDRGGAPVGPESSMDAYAINAQKPTSEQPMQSSLNFQNPANVQNNSGMPYGTNRANMPQSGYASSLQPVDSLPMGRQAEAYSMGQNPIDAQSIGRQAEAYVEAKLDPHIALIPDSNKKIEKIIVFYSDNSFRTFIPSQGE